MTALLRAELIKLRTTRTFAAMAGLAIATSTLIAGVISIVTEPTKDSVLLDVYASDTSSVFILLLAVVGISGEWRHRTITSSLLAAPDRRRFLVAKTVAYAVAGAVLSLLTAAAVAAVATVILPVRDLPLPELGEVLAQWGRNAVLAALLGAFGVGIGGLVRNQMISIVTLLLMMFIAEPLVLALAPDYGRFGPLGALSVSAAGLPAEAAAMEESALMGVLPAVLALLAWVGVAAAAATAALVRRDLE